MSISCCRMTALAAKGKHPVLQLAGFRQRLIAHAKSRKELTALEAEVRALAEGAAADAGLLRIHREIVTALRRARAKTGQSCVRTCEPGTMSSLLPSSNRTQHLRPPS